MYSNVRLNISPKADALLLSYCVEGKREREREIDTHTTIQGKMAKITFNDDDNALAIDVKNDVVATKSNDAVDSSSNDNSDSDVSDDDDAPEEENMNESVKAIQELEREQAQAVIKAKNDLKIKRKQKTMKFQEQQKVKKEQLQFERKQLLEFEQQLKLNESHHDDSKTPRSEDILNEEVMEELPLEFLSNLDNNDSSSSSSSLKATHKTFEEEEEGQMNNGSAHSLEDDDYLKAAQNTHKNKLKTLRMLHKTEVKKGSFIISRAPSTHSKSLAPKVEKKIMNVRDKWLRRKTLNKR